MQVFHQSVAALVLVALSPGSCLNHDSEVRAQLARRVQALADSGFAGQVLVARNEQVLLDEAYGFADQGHTPITRVTGFDIASATKAFTAAAILSLRDSDRLRLTSTLGDLLRDAPTHKKHITIEQLLSHTSGLRTTYAADGETDRATAVRKLLAQPLAGAPGGDFRYSDDGYVLLAAVVELASGASYERYLATHVLAPAGMGHTVFWGDVDFGDPSRVAAFQRPLDATRLRRQWGQRGSGGIISTADDLYRWWIALSRGHVLVQTSFDELTQERRRLPSGIGVGYGWFWSATATGARSLWTRGNEDFGHNAIVAVYPQNRLVIIVTSNRFAGDEPWSRRIKSALEPLLLGGGK